MTLRSRYRKMQYGGGPIPMPHTNLTPKQDSMYQGWRSKLPQNLQYEGNYDLKRLWMENPGTIPSSNMHFPDRYKLPNHPTFSNESMYFNPSNQYMAGQWKETDSSWNYTPYNTKFKSPIIERKAFGGDMVKPFEESTPDPGIGQKTFFKEYLNSPNYKKRLITQGYKNPDQVIKDRTVNLNKTSIRSMNAESSHYVPNKGVYYSPSQSKELGYPKESAIAHEFSHPAGSLLPGHNPGSTSLELNDKEVQEFKTRNKLTKVNPNSLPVGDYMNWLHDTMEQEPKADMDALRYRLKVDGIYDTGTQIFDKKILQKAKERYKDDNIVNRLFKNFSDDDLLYLMNNVASNKQQFKPFA